MRNRFVILRLLLLAGGAVAQPDIAFAEPPPDHPSAEQAGRLLGLPEARPAEVLPYQGVVLRAIDSNAFTFIEVLEHRESGDGSRWIAAPRVALTPGMRIRFDDGRVMTGFYSRKQQMTFESITFVNRVVPVTAPGR